MSDRTPDSFFQELYDQAPCAYLILSADGTIVQANQTFLAWSRYRWQDLHNRRFTDLMTVGARMLYQLHILPRLHLEMVVTEALCDLVCADGTIMPVLYNIRHRPDGTEQEGVYWLALFSIYTRRAYERELLDARKRAEDASAMHEQFMALVSHELKTPVANVAEGFQQLARRLHAIYPRESAVTQYLAEQVASMHSMITALFDVSRIEAGQFQVHLSVCNMVAIIQNTIRKLAPHPDPQRISFQPITAVVSVVGDPERLAQVVQIVLENALKYSPTYTTITVWMTLSDDTVRVSVQDYGYGIAQEAMPHLFERFYRVVQPYATDQSGLGIGLYLAREIIALHHGTIEIDTIEGAGTTVHVSLPLATPSQLEAL